MKLIAKGNTESYEKLLSQLNLTPLDKRRDILSYTYTTRKQNKYTVLNPNTERMKKIANNLYATLVKQGS